MARFQFGLGRLVGRAAVAGLFWRRSPRAAQAHEAQAERGPRQFAGPGWFESSWELVRGLEVHEGLPADADLAEWLAAGPHCIKPATPSAIDEFDLAGFDEAPWPDAFDRFGIDGLELA